jgi:LysM repeat protein
VPRIIAAAVIGRDPRRFGFDVLLEEEALARYDVVRVPVPTILERIARWAGMSSSELRSINDDLAPTRRSTPVRNYPIYVKRGAGEKVARRLGVPEPTAGTASASASGGKPASAAASASGSAGSGSGSGASSAASRASSKPEVIRYRVKRGDTLSEIAERYGVRVSDLKAWNPPLARRPLYRGETIEIRPRRRPEKELVYAVERGDSLSTIAERFGVHYRDLAEWNGIAPPYRIKVGQRLVIRPGRRTPPPITYVVQRGNTLQSIAAIFSVTYRQIMEWNDLRSGMIRVGQKLVIRPRKRFEVVRYRVQRGDTVSRIARRFGVPVAGILTANGLNRRGTIRRGQSLVIFVEKE